MLRPLSRLALGTVQFGLPYGIVNRDGQVCRDEAAAILNYASAVGLDVLDTAIAYGECEHRLGEIGVGSWRIVSKLPPIPESCADISGWVQNMVLDSLRRLRIDRLFGLLLHQPKQLTGPMGKPLFESLTRLKRSGIVEKIGISIYEPQELADIFPSFRLDVVQAPLNLLDRRLISSGWLTKLRQAGTEVHFRSVFLQGLLLMNAAGRPPYFRKWKAIWELWDRWLADSRLSGVEACLGFAFANDHADRVIVGVETLKQFKEILSATKVKLPPVPDELNCEDLDLINPSRWPSTRN